MCLFACFCLNVFGLHIQSFAAPLACSLAHTIRHRLRTLQFSSDHYRLSPFSVLYASQEGLPYIHGKYELCLHNDILRIIRAILSNRFHKHGWGGRFKRISSV